MSCQLRQIKVCSWSILSCSVPVFYFFCYLVWKLNVVGAAWLIHEIPDPPPPPPPTRETQIDGDERFQLARHGLCGLWEWSVWQAGGGAALCGWGGRGGKTADPLQAGRQTAKCSARTVTKRYAFKHFFRIILFFREFLDYPETYPKPPLEKVTCQVWGSNPRTLTSTRA